MESPETRPDRPASTDPRLERILGALRAVRDGDFRRRIVVSGDDVVAEICVLCNDIAEANQGYLAELERVGAAVGRDGTLGQRLAPGAGAGDWERQRDKPPPAPSLSPLPCIGCVTAQRRTDAVGQRACDNRGSEQESSHAIEPRYGL